MIENENKQEEQVLVSVASERAEALGGVLIAFFAALMAISDLTNNNIEEEKMLAQGKNNNYFSWYQSKSVKQSLQENELSTFEILLKTGVVKPEKEAAIAEDIKKIGSVTILAVLHFKGKTPCTKVLKISHIESKPFDRS